eukprot:2255084-Rhodomonas_salina.2
MIPSVLGGAFGGGTLGYSYFQMTVRTLSLLVEGDRPDMRLHVFCSGSWKASTSEATLLHTRLQGAQAGTSTRLFCTVRSRSRPAR